MMFGISDKREFAVAHVIPLHNRIHISHTWRCHIAFAPAYQGTGDICTIERERRKGREGDVNLER